MGGVVSDIFMIDQFTFTQQNKDWQWEFRKVENACKERIVRVKKATINSEYQSRGDWEGQLFAVYIFIKHF
jgi:hypothetical protein